MAGVKGKCGHPRRIIPRGTRFGRLVVIGEAPVHKQISYSFCKCDCGRIVERPNAELLYNGLQSCGCLLHDAHLIHGDCRRGKVARLFRIWSGMKARCFNKGSSIYKYYGGRGISICSEWMEYKNFAEWARANGYRNNLSIDRVDSNGNYEPKNCRWATVKEQSTNRRSSIYITLNGEKKHISEWCKKFGTEPHLAHSRWAEGKRGMDLFKPRVRPLNKTKENTK